MKLLTGGSGPKLSPLIKTLAIGKKQRKSKTKPLERRRGIDIPETPQICLEEFVPMIGSRMMLFEGEDECSDGSFFESSNHSIVEELDEESSDDSSLSEGELGRSFVEEKLVEKSEKKELKAKRKQSSADFEAEENPVVGNKFGKTLQEEAWMSDSSEEESEETLKMESDLANGDITSILSFLRVSDDKVLQVPKSRVKSQLEFQPEGLKQRRSKSVSLSKKSDTNQSSSILVLDCYFCQKLVYGSNNIACFSVCEHYVHEFCLLELIDHRKYAPVVENKWTEDGMACKKEVLFCPKCHKI